MCLVPAGNRLDEFPNTFAPEGASRCRALTSGLKDRAAGRKEHLSEKWRDLQCKLGQSQEKPDLPIQRHSGKPFKTFSILSSAGMPRQIIRCWFPNLGRRSI
jgi:hypothetical protein